jgi:hypothetical protein
VPQRLPIRRSTTIDTGSRRLRRQQYPMNRAISHTITRTTTMTNANCIQIDPPMPRKTTSRRSPQGYGRAAVPVSIAVMVVRRYKVSNSGLVNEGGAETG